VSYRITSAQIRAARAALGWTQRKLGEKAGIHPITVCRYERNSLPFRTDETLGRMEAALRRAGVIFSDRGISLRA